MLPKQPPPISQQLQEDSNCDSDSLSDFLQNVDKNQLPSSDCPQVHELQPSISELLIPELFQPSFKGLQDSAEQTHDPQPFEMDGQCPEQLRQGAQEAGQNLPPTRSSGQASGRVSVFGHIQQGEGLAEPLKLVLSQLDPNYASLSHRDISSSSNLIKFLQELVQLGKIAEQDLKLCTISQDEGYCEARDLDSEMMDGVCTQQTSPETEGHSGFMFQTEDKLCELKEHLKQSRAALYNLQKAKATHQNVKIEDFNVSQILCELMNKWQNLEAWIHVGLVPPLPDQDREDLYTQLDELFRGFFICVGLTKSDNSEDQADSNRLSEIRRVLSVAWVYVTQPDISYLAKKETLELPSGEKGPSIRLLGLSQSDLDMDNCHAFLCQESEYKKKTSHEDLGLSCDENSQATSHYQSRGPQINVQRRSFSCHRSSKRSSEYCFEKLYRFVFEIRLKLGSCSDSQVTIECLSLPFSIRTGSEQLWPSCGAIMWSCFSHNNLYSEPFTPVKTMETEQVLKMLLSWCQTQVPSKLFDDREIIALNGMLQSVKNSHNDHISLRELLQDDMPSQGTKKNTKLNKFSCYTWFVGAVNALKYYIECSQSRGELFFLNEVQCRVLVGQANPGSALIRASWTSMENISGKVPLTNLTICLYSRKHVIFIQIQIKDKLSSPQFLCLALKNIKDNKGKPKVLTILPEHSLLADWPACQNNADISINDYKTRFMKVESLMIIKDLDINQPQQNNRDDPHDNRNSEDPQDNRASAKKRAKM